MAKYTAHFIPNSHLDREWALDAQQTRDLTVEFLDGLLEILATVPEYTFLLDSQVAPLEDYLEIRPEQESALRRYVQAGRLHIGPWYSAPDMNCLSGESVTRNLLFGHKRTARFGRVMKVGYTPFGFVHISQLPQVYQQFGIDTCYFYRGIDTASTPKAEFCWEGPDGSRVLASRMSRQPRHNFFMNIWRRGMYGTHPGKLSRRADWREGEMPFKIASPEARYEPGEYLKPFAQLDPHRVAQELDALFDREKEQFRTTELAFMHGFDTSAPSLAEQEVVRVCQQHWAGRDDVRLVYSSMPAFTEAVKASINLDALPRKRGEMKFPEVLPNGFRQSFVNIISTRPRQKHLTAKVETDLIRYAEPFAAVAALLGTAWPEPFLDEAWKFFLLSTAHDTIGGCGIDRIEEDAMNRLRQAESVARMVLRRSLAAIVGRIGFQGGAADGLALVLFNPAPFARHEVVDCIVDVPVSFGFDALALFDAAGRPVPFTCQRLDRAGKIYRDRRDTAMYCDSIEYRLAIDANDIPPLGYTTLYLRGAAEPVAAPEDVIARSPQHLENEWLCVTVQSNGTLDVRHKETGRTYAGLHLFEDMGEAGHPWTHVDVRRDVRMTSGDVQARIALIENGPLQATVEVAFDLAVPATTSFDPETHYTDLYAADSWRDATETVPLSITSRFTLRKGARTVDIRTTVVNRAEFHRLRLHFPTDLEASTSHADSAYTVERRQVATDPEHPWYSMPHRDFPFLRFTGLDDGRDGFAFLSNGIREYETLEDERHTLAITLFRAVDNILCVTPTWTNAGGKLNQSLGELTFHYGLMFHAEGWETGGVLAAAERFACPVIPCQAGIEPGGTLPPCASFLAVSDTRLQLSALKRAEHGTASVVRVFNPTDQELAATLTLPDGTTTATRIDMAEEREFAVLPLVGRTLPLTVGPHEVVTLALQGAAS